MQDLLAFIKRNLKIIAGAAVGFILGAFARTQFGIGPDAGYGIFEAAGAFLGGFAAARFLK